MPPLGHVQVLEPSLALPVPPSAWLLSGSLHFGRFSSGGQRVAPGVLEVHASTWREHLPPCMMWVTCPADHCGSQWRGARFLAGPEPIPGAGWDLALASPDSQGLGAQECGLLQRGTGMLLPGGTTGICQQHPPLCFMNGHVERSLLFQFSSCVQFPDPVCGRALNLSPQEVWPGLAPGSTSSSPGNVLPDKRVCLGVCVSQQNSVSQVGLCVTWTANQAYTTEANRDSGCQAQGLPWLTTVHMYCHSSVSWLHVSGLCLACFCPRLAGM